jgi:hypothetical protein
MTDFRGLLKALAGEGVEFIIVGGAAATAHGSARLTLDLDVVYGRTRGNLSRLVRSLGRAKPYPRGAPPGLPFRWDERTLRAGLNFTLTTTLGDLDLLGEIAGGGSYDDLLPHSVTLSIYDLSCRVLGLDALIRTKRAAGRPKDFESLAELEVIREERRKENQG